MQKANLAVKALIEKLEMNSIIENMGVIAATPDTHAYELTKPQHTHKDYTKNKTINHKSMSPLFETNFRISMSQGGVTNTTLIPFKGKLEAFFTRLQQPEIGNKDGSYYLRGVAKKRTDSYLQSSELLIIDADKSVDPLTGELSDGAPNPSLAHEFLKSQNFRHVIHSTYSSRIDFHRYRIVIPMPLNDKIQLSRAVDILTGLFHQNGIFIADVPENKRWSQPWYFPRMPQETISLFKGYSHA